MKSLITRFFHALLPHAAILLLLQVSTMSGQTLKTWIGQGAGGAGTDFNTGTNWSPGGAPSATDSCVMLLTSAATITVSADISVYALWCDITSGTAQIFRLDANTKTLTVLNDLNGSASGDPNTHMEFSVGGGSPGGKIQVNGNTFLGTTGSSPTLTRGTGTNSQFVFRGNVTYGTSSLTSGSSFPTTYVFDAPGTQTFTVNSASSVLLSSVKIGDVNTPTVQLAGSSNATLSSSAAAANLTISPNCQLDLGANDLNRSSVGGTFTLGAGATMKLGAALGGQTGSNFPLNYSSVTLDPASTVEYNATGGTNQIIYATPTYGSLVVSQDTSAAGGALTISADFITDTGATFDGSSFIHIVNGNLVNNGLHLGSGKVLLQSGSSQHSVSGTSAYRNLELNDALGAALASNVRIGGTLTLTNGAFGVGSDSLFLGGQVSATTGSLTSGTAGTVLYQGSNGQKVLAANYGNLTLNNARQVLAFNGTIGVAGIFSPDISTVDTVGGSTINFNGSASQLIPAFKYYNLTSSSTGPRVLAPSGTIGIAGTFSPGTNAYTITGSTIEYNGPTSQTLPSGFTTYYNLVASNSLQVTGIPGLVVTALLEVKSGVFNSSSTFNSVLIDAAGTLTTPFGDTLNIGGNWTNNGTFTSNSSALRFNGSTAQTISGASTNTVDKLIVSNTTDTALTMNANCTVNSLLSLLSVNIIVPGTKTLTISGTGTVSRTSGHVIGSLKKNYGAAGSKTFEVGTANGYSPVTVNAASGGTFTVKAAEGPDTNAIGPNVLQRTWTLTSAGITQADLTFSYLAGDVVGNEANYVLSTHNGAWAVVGGTVNTVSHSATISNVTAFGNWTLGESPSFLGLSISDINVSEGNNGTASADFVVNLSGTSSQTVTIGYTTHDSTALVADNDYIAGSDVLTIAPGETSGIVSVLLNGDTKREPNELLTLTLSAPTNAALLNSLALCTIENDDSLPRVSIADFAGAEGTNGDSTQFNFIVTLSNPSNDSISFHFHTENKTAKADTDYQKVTDGFITINPGDTSALIAVIVNGDTLAEPDDTFFVKLSGAVNATLDDSVAAGMILNDDGATLSIGDVIDFEGNSTATAKHFNFKLQLSNPLPQLVTVNYSTDSSEGSATGGVDFNRKNTTATIPPGQTTGFITIDVKGDTVDESDETFNVFIWNSINATVIHNTGTGTILNDDLNITVTDTAKAEGQSGVTNFTFKVKLSKSSTHPVSVRYATADSNTVADNDYADTAGTMTFSPGTISKDLVIRVNGDVIDENHEKFFVRLDTVTNAIIADSQGVGTITNDDAKFTINDVSVAEGDTGETNAVFTVSLTSPSAATVKVTTISADSVATLADNDYFFKKKDTLTFLPGDLSKQVTVRVRGDIQFEGNEIFGVKLASQGLPSVPIADSTGTGTITNDDGRICARKYFDTNHNGQFDPGDAPMPNTTFRLKSLTRPLVTIPAKKTDINGEVCFDSIQLDTYRLTEVLDTNYATIIPDSSAFVYTVHAQEDIQSLWLNGAASSAEAFRTGRYEDWAREVNAKGKQKGIPRVATRVEAKFYLVSPQAATSLKLHFNMAFTGAIYDDSMKSSMLDSIVKTKDKTITASFPLAHVYLIEGFGAKGSPLVATASWAVSPTASVTQPIFDKSQFLVRELRMPMPNLHNAGEELFAAPSGPFAAGMLVGVPQGTKKGKSVFHKKYADVLKSFSYKNGLHNASLLHCLDKFDGKLKPIDKQQKSLPPNKQNNRLFAEMTTFKLNIAASQIGIFPGGFGQLIYLDSADISNPLNGRTLQEIADIGDTLLSCAAISSPPPNLDQLYDVLRKVDTTFAGPVDTLSFATGTRFKGVRVLRDVSFLYALPGAMASGQDVRPPADQNIPLSYRLEQNYPNPFNPTTTIEFQLEEPASVTLKIYNTLGQEVTTVVDREEMDEGTQSVEFDGGSLSSGVYFYRIDIRSLESGKSLYYQTKKMVLMK